MSVLDRGCAAAWVAGYGLRSTTEVSGLGTDPNLLRFVKNHFMGQVRWQKLPSQSQAAAPYLKCAAGSQSSRCSIRAS